MITRDIELILFLSANQRKIMGKYIFILAFYIPISLTACTQVVEENIVTQADSLKIPVDTATVSPFKNTSYNKFENNWVELTKGISYIEEVTASKSIVNDSKISILKIDPTIAEFEFKSATQIDKEMLCVADYAEMFNYNIVINAGMYDVKSYFKSKGLLINNESYANNPNLYPNYNMMICANPKKEGLPNFTVNDLTKSPWSTLSNKYESFSQGLRMIDADGKPMFWNKRYQSCSQLIVAEDKAGMIYFIFTRSPYTQNFMINYMVEMGLRNAVYMEGGPQTSLFVDIDDYRIEKLGSYVSNTYPTDSNSEYWSLPNVIGVRVNQD